MAMTTSQFFPEGDNAPDNALYIANSIQNTPMSDANLEKAVSEGPQPHLTKALFDIANIINLEAPLASYEKDASPKDVALEYHKAASLYLLAFIIGNPSLDNPCKDSARACLKEAKEVIRRSKLPEQYY